MGAKRMIWEAWTLISGAWVDDLGGDLGGTEVDLAPTGAKQAPAQRPHTLHRDGTRPRTAMRQGIRETSYMLTGYVRTGTKSVPHSDGPFARTAAKSQARRTKRAAQRQGTARTGRTGAQQMSAQRWTDVWRKAIIVYRVSPHSDQATRTVTGHLPAQRQA